MRSRYIFSIVLLTFFSSCTRYYQLLENKNPEKYTDNDLYEWQLLADYNHIIIHTPQEVFELKELQFDEQSNSLIGKKVSIGSQELFYYEKVMQDSDHIAKRNPHDKKALTNQVHFFCTEYTELTETNVIHLPLSQVTKVDVSKQASHINALVSIPIVMVSGAAGMGIFLAIACNCPRVYLNDGNGLHVEKSLFTGAISPQLERQDIKQIPDYNSRSQTLNVRLQNDQKEQQYIDQVALVVVHHDSDVLVTMDQQANLYTSKKCISPTEVTDGQGTSVRIDVAAIDDLSYDFRPEKVAGICELVAQFPGIQTNNATFILRIKNTEWAGYAYHEFEALFGDEYASWVEKNKDKPRSEREKWMRQEGIQLVLELKRNGSWEPIEDIDLVGDIAFEQLAVPLTNIPAGPIELRLRSGFYFWQIDYIALDDQQQHYP
ncbi:MAG: hypothetical protein RLZZ301_1683, partial [Bacteroidota bacterium]